MTDIACRTARLLFLTVVLVWPSVAVVQAASDRQRVLFISSYHPSFPSFDRQVEGLRAALNDAGYPSPSMVLDIEFIDSKRFPTATQLPIFRAALA
ncbi:unnamed protein product, partial [Laminaria digitata]